MTNPKYTHAEYLRDCKIRDEAPDEVEYADDFGGYYAFVAFMIDGKREYRLSELVDGCWRTDLNGVPISSLSDIRKRIAFYEREQWISVNDSLPRQYTEIVLVSRNKGIASVLPAFHNGIEFISLSIAGNHAFKEPTHWKPLPQPPQERDDD